MIEINSQNFRQDYAVMTYEQLAKKYGIGRSSVRKIVKQLGLSKKRGSKEQIVIIGD